MIASKFKSLNKPITLLNKESTMKMWILICLSVIILIAGITNNEGFSAGNIKYISISILTILALTKFTNDLTKSQLSLLAIAIIDLASKPFNLNSTYLVISLVGIFMVVGRIFVKVIMGEISIGDSKLDRFKNIFRIKLKPIELSIFSKLIVLTLIITYILNSSTVYIQNRGYEDLAITNETLKLLNINIMVVTIPTISLLLIALNLKDAILFRSLSDMFVIYSYVYMMNEDNFSNYIRIILITTIDFMICIYSRYRDYKNIGIGDDEDE